MIDIENIVKKIKPLDPEKVILFGSYANGTASSDSDIDILIIKESDKKPSSRVKEALDAVWGNVPHIEPHVLTPQELQKAIEQNRFFITKEVLENGRVIYERPQQ